MKTVDQMVAQQEAAAAREETTALTALFKSAGLPTTEPVGAEVLAYSRGERSISAELRAQVEARILVLTRNREFARRLLEGGHEEMRFLTIVSAVLLAPIQEG
jgi:hypothetical protein